MLVPLIILSICVSAAIIIVLRWSKPWKTKEHLRIEWPECQLPSLPPFKTRVFEYKTRTKASWMEWVALVTIGLMAGAAIWGTIIFIYSSIYSLL